jgi:hypothetical protein
MHVISLYLLLYACAATFDVMCVKKNRGNQTGPYTIIHQHTVSATVYTCHLSLGFYVKFFFGLRMHFCHSLGDFPS